MENWELHYEDRHAVPQWLSGSYGTDPESLVLFKDKIDNLSAKAQEVVSLVLDMPDDFVVFKLFSRENAKFPYVNRYYLKKYLKLFRGWRESEVNRAFVELRKIFL